MCCREKEFEDRRHIQELDSSFNSIFETLAAEKIPERSSKNLIYFGPETISNQTVLIFFWPFRLATISESLVNKLWEKANEYIGMKTVAIGVSAFSLDLNQKTEFSIQNLKELVKEFHFICLTITEVVAK